MFDAAVLSDLKMGATACLNIKAKFIMCTLAWVYVGISLRNTMITSVDVSAIETVIVRRGSYVDIQRDRHGSRLESTIWRFCECVGLKVFG